MSTSSALDDLRSRILSRYALLFLKTWEEERWENALAILAMEIEQGLVVWSAVTGAQPEPDETDTDSTDPLIFLDRIRDYPPDHLFYIKDFHPYLSDPAVVRRLRDLLPALAAQNKTLLFVSPTGAIPIELEREASVIDLPLPGIEELRDELAAVLEERQAEPGPPLELSEEHEERLLTAVIGLTAHEAHKALARAVLGREKLDADALAGLVSEKKRMVEGNELLEFYDLQEGMSDIGGLDGLKDWLAQRSEAFSPRAAQQGIPTPKGLFLLGIQGCGKSLTARAAARQLGFPLLRLDAYTLLSGEQGQSEKNMRDVLNLVETMAPVVLWVDEIEKGFAGTEGVTAQNATMARLVGRFLTWMEENRKPVFVVATANTVHNLPPELLRRGRFDELFFLDLPSHYERKEILRIHLTKHGWNPDKYDLEAFANETDGYSGAEIAQIVVAAMLESYGKGRILSQKGLTEAAEETVPLSVTMEEKIFEMREWARGRCRPATYDSRVIQMLEEEKRQGPTETRDEAALLDRRWKELAEHGQLKAAAVEYVRRHDYVTFPQLQQDFAGFLETDGEQGLALRSDPNVVLWVGMSRELAELLASLIAAKRLYVHPADVERYRKVEKGVRLPRLTELSEQRIGRPAWFPVSLRNLPPAGGSGRFARVARMKLSR